MGSGKARCRHCRLVFSFRDVPEVSTPPQFESRRPQIDHKDTPVDVLTEIYEDSRPKVQVFVCGECGDKCKVTHTRDGVRHYKCTGCGKRYKVAGEEQIALRDS